MIRVCTSKYHRGDRVFGEKPPYDDTTETHGFCPECFEKEIRDIEEYQEGRKNPVSTIMEKLIEAGIPIDHHESDLYALKTPVSTRIIESYRHRENITTFRSQIDGKTWYDIPFAFDKYWEEKLKRNPKRMTKMECEEYINETGIPDHDHPEYGGRVTWRWIRRHGEYSYGTWLRKHDPIAFELACQDIQDY